MNKYKCRICKKEVELMKSHLKNTHKMNIDEYYSKFDGEKDVYEKYMYESKVERQKRSPNSIHFYLNKGMTNEQALEELKRHNLNNPFHRLDISPRQKQYWINKGFSEEQALNKIHILNSNSLENLISIYGEIEGKIRYEKYIKGQKSKHNKIIKNIMNENNVSHDESKKILKSKMQKISPKSLIFWIERGYTEEEAKLEMYKIGRRTSPRCLDYWLIKTNNNYDVAKKLLRDYQDNNSIESISNREKISLDDAQKIQNSIFSKMLQTLYSSGAILRPDFKSDFEKYKQKVVRLTEINYRRYKNIIDPLNLRSKEYHIDHRYSIIQGFIDNVEEIVISSPFNLEIKKSQDNCSKQGKCDISINELLEKINNNYEN
jgi:hypothetical protein